MVFMVLIHDGSVEAANKYLGYKRFGKVVSLELPNEDIVEQLLKNILFRLTNTRYLKENL